MALVNKPDESIFASSAKQGEVDNFPDLLRGWGITFDQTQGIPPMEWFNFLFKRLDEKHAYLMQRGLPEWSATQDYTKGSCVQFDGVSYRALKDSKNNSPNESDSQYWVRWGFALSEIAQATLTQYGITKLYTGYDSQSEDLALTPKTGYQLKQFIDSNTRALGNVIPNSKKSSAVNSNSEDTVANSAAVKKAYDKAVEAKTAADNAQSTANSKQSPATTLAGYGIVNFKIENFVGDVNSLQTDGIYAVTQASRSQNLPVAGNGCHIQVIAGGDGRWCRQIAYIAYSTDMYERHQTSYQTDSWSAWKKLNTDGIPIGAVVSFPRAVTNPVGFLKANGTTFNQQTFPDLYQVLGNSNKLPDLTRSDVGMTAYFAVDNIPAGWIAFDEIATQVTEQRYPELYRHLVGKYGSINSVPKVTDRFLRNAGNGLSVGQTQEDAIRDITGQLTTYRRTDRQSLKMPSGAFKMLERVDGSMGNGGSDDWAMTVNFAASNVVRTANENRPKSLILKLCIKAINSLDDVVFWIKSHGEVTNAGTLDAGRLAQGLQDKADRNHTHTVSQITDFNQVTSQLISQIIDASITYQQIGGFEVRKYPDGTMIQTYAVNVGEHQLTTGKLKTFNWAVAFASTPMIWVTANATDNRNGAQVDLGALVGIVISDCTQATCAYRTNEIWRDYNHNPTMQFLAIGRWK